MDRSAVLISGSRYITQFKSILAHFDLQVFHAYNLKKFKQQAPVILDHPLGLMRSVKSVDAENLNYLRSSWISYLQHLEDWVVALRLTDLK